MRWASRAAGCHPEVAAGSSSGSARPVDLGHDGGSVAPGRRAGREGPGRRPLHRSRARAAGSPPPSRLRSDGRPVPGDRHAHIGRDARDGDGGRDPAPLIAHVEHAGGRIPMRDRLPAKTKGTPSSPMSIVARSCARPGTLARAPRRERVPGPKEPGGTCTSIPPGARSTTLGRSGTLTLKMLQSSEGHPGHSSHTHGEMWHAFTNAPGKP